MSSVVIDTDPGTDDAIALMMALQSNGLDVIGITTVGGNAHLTETTKNTLSLLEYLSRPNIQVHVGRADPLEGKYTHAYEYHGEGGLTVQLPEPRIKPTSHDAVAFIANKIPECSELVDIIALGPLTNIALALNKNPDLSQSIGKIVVMGGAISVPGNITTESEFNIYNDPKAANIVFSSGIPIKLVGLDVCNLVYLETKDLKSLGESRAANLSKHLLGNWFKQMPAGEKYSLYDPLAIMCHTNSGTLRYKSAKVEVDERATGSLGKTTAHFGEGPIQVAIAVDQKNVSDMVISTLNNHL